MTDYQFSSILEMVDVILEGCNTIDEAREKIMRVKKSRDKADPEKGNDKTD